MSSRIGRLAARAGRALAMLRKEGAAEVVSRIRRGKRRNIVDQFGLVSQAEPARSAQDGEAPPNTINWVITPFSAGVGGHINSMRFIAMLAARGYRMCIVVDAGSWMGTSQEVSEKLQATFGPVDAQVVLGTKNAPASYAAVATGWEQAYAVRNSMVARERFYFVQDFEPWFYAHGSEYQFAEDTYSFGFTGLTAGSWLASKLRDEYGMNCHSVGFSYDKKLYKAGPHPGHSGHRVFFYARPSTERRGFELGLLALDRLCRAVPGVTVVFAGADVSRYAIPFAHESLGSVSVDRLPAIYRSCDLALVISMTNLSLLPLELMACGVPVVSNTGAWAEWLLNEQNAALAEPNVVALADAMVALLADESERQRLAAAGMAFAITTSWEREGDAMASALASRGCVPAG